MLTVRMVLLMRGRRRKVRNLLMAERRTPSLVNHSLPNQQRHC